MSSLGGSTGNPGPTPQQQQLMTEQALTTANLNQEENAQRKSILNAMLGTRVFRGSALSRALRGNAPGAAAENAPPASQSQINSYGQIIVPPTLSLLDEQARSSGSGSTPSGGTGGSGGGGRAPGGFAGGGGGGGRR
jgi:uncharacterized membrane protein YgcG